MAPHHAAYFERHSVAKPVSTIHAEQSATRRVGIGCGFLLAGLFWAAVIISILVYFKTRHQ